MTGEWDAGTLVELITAAIENSDPQAAVAALRVLAIVDPARAQDVLDTIRAGLAIREGEL